MGKENMVSITQKELMERKIDGVIITIGSNLERYSPVLNITTDLEVFGCDLTECGGYPFASYVLKLADVKVLHEVLGRAIASYEPPEAAETPPKHESSHERLPDDDFYTGLLNRIYNAEVERLKIFEDLIIRHKGI